MFGKFMQYREVLVTGGTGALGQRVARALADRGRLPRLLVRIGSEGKIPPDLRPRVRITPGDAAVREFVENGAQGTWAVAHLTAVGREDPKAGRTFAALHVGATRNAVAAAAHWGIGRFVMVSAAGPPPEGPPGGYFDSWRLAEEIVGESGLSWTIFRIPVRVGGGGFECAPPSLEEAAEQVAGAFDRPDTAGKVIDLGSAVRA